MSETLNDRLQAMLIEIEDEGCGCDLMNGVTCGIHAKLHDLRNLLQKVLSGERMAGYHMGRQRAIEDA